MPSVRARLNPLPMAALALVLAAAAPANSPVDVPEPAGLYDGPQHGYVPATLSGAQVLDAAQLDRLRAEAAPVLIDVSLADRKPDNLPPGTLWLPAHRSIPGATWLPDAGSVPLPPEREAALLARVAELTGDDKAKPVVVFCHPECWGSWNLGKRLVQAGYEAVHWFPLGIEGWQEEHETTVIRRDPVWARSEARPAQR